MARLFDFYKEGCAGIDLKFGYIEHAGPHPPRSP